MEEEGGSGRGHVGRGSLLTEYGAGKCYHAGITEAFRQDLAASYRYNVRSRPAIPSLHRRLNR
jgi:hypothetical protein